MIGRTSKYVNANQKEILHSIQLLSEALAILQHHDAVAGTEKQHVTDDYVKTGYKAFVKINEHITQIITETVYQETEEDIPEFEYCHLNETARACEGVYEAIRNSMAVQVNLVDANIGNEEVSRQLRVKVPPTTLKIVD